MEEEKNLMVGSYFPADFVHEWRAFVREKKRKSDPSQTTTARSLLYTAMTNLMKKEEENGKK